MLVMTKRAIERAGQIVLAMMQNFHFEQHFYINANFNEHRSKLKLKEILMGKSKSIHPKEFRSECFPVICFYLHK